MTKTFVSDNPRELLPTHKERFQNEIKYLYRTISLSNEKTSGVKNWRCDSCGQIVFQYHNEPVAVFDGAVNVAECYRPTDHLCRKCNIIFRVT